MQHEPYRELPGRVIETDERFKHVMAITLDPTARFERGVARCITSREGDLVDGGALDHSELRGIALDPAGRFAIGERLPIRHEKEMIASLTGRGDDFLGLEDPDIWIDDAAGLMHLYFTMPIFHGALTNHAHTRVHLGHAVGRDLMSLTMTLPVLTDSGQDGAKEVSIAPLNKEGYRFNLVESSNTIDGMTYSVVRSAVALEMGEPWEFGDVVFHPAEHGIPWIAGHASPGPLLPRDFIDVGAGKLLGVMNGREADTRKHDRIHHGLFSVGLFVYDYENGGIEWVSEQPLIRDSEARTITFASQFVPGRKGEGTLYAHVDDSFVRAYALDAAALRPLIP
ncbi:MAG TPA: hypothetical protein VMT99_00435 [Candidatus Paceibacterota bacterium]|nr:hypothetical protein [Candidatus Paceibacterota bacterium]